MVFLCEFPTPFLGSYSEDYFALPAEVITTALKAHQRYFSVGSASSPELMPRFAAVRDGGTDHLAGVVRGNERVLNARLADALFYWNFDQKKSPDEARALLDKVTWLEGFGSVGDKSRRLVAVARWLWTAGLGDTAHRPGRLGPGGGNLQERSGQRDDQGRQGVHQAGGLHRLPVRRAGGRTGGCLPGGGKALLSALGRRRTCRATASAAPCRWPIAWTTWPGAGWPVLLPPAPRIPTPCVAMSCRYLRILLDLEARIDLEAALAGAMGPIAETGGRQQCRRSSGGNPRIRADPPGRTLHRQPPLRSRGSPSGHARPLAGPGGRVGLDRALTGYRDREDFQLLATGFKRCRNILKGDVLDRRTWTAAWKDGWPAGGEPTEKISQSWPNRLKWSLRDQVIRLLRPVWPRRKRVGITTRSSLFFRAWGPAIDAFFDTVRVNVPDEALRRVRHAFLREIHGLFVRFADFSQVAPLE